jgi:hypothetical protein
MRAPDRELLAVVAELQQAIAAGREPLLSAAEWALLADFIEESRQNKPRRRRGHHKTMARHFQGKNRRMLRTGMEFLKIKLRHDPAERELKRAIRANGDAYDLNWRVAQVMHERLVKSGRKNPPTIAYLKNVLSRSSADEPDWDPTV